jgi:SAM-dependent methyltransferase
MGLGLVSALRPMLHITGRRFCPVCDRPVRFFHPLDSFYANMWRRHGFDLAHDRWETLNIAEMSCPLCSCLDRERLIALYFDKIKNELPRTGRLIEFAAIFTLGRKIRKLLPDWTIRSADLFDPRADDKIDICDMKLYADDSVDLFVCCHVIEHVQDEGAAMRELLRIVKPGGRGILLVPIHLDLATSRCGEPITGTIDPNSEESAERWRQFAQLDHVRLHSHSDFVDLISSAGFSVEAVTERDFAAGAYHRCGITATSTLYIAHKSASGASLVRGFKAHS